MVLPCPRYDDADDQTTPALDHHHGLSSLLGELRAPEVGVKLVGSAYKVPGPLTGRVRSTVDLTLQRTPQTTI